MSDRFDEIRREITENDEAIVAAVNRRLELVTELWELKAELGIDTVDPDRERQPAGGPGGGERRAALAAPGSIGS